MRFLPFCYYVPIDPIPGMDDLLSPNGVILATSYRIILNNPKEAENRHITEPKAAENRHTSSLGKLVARKTTYQEFLIKINTWLTKLMLFD